MAPSAPATVTENTEDEPLGAVGPRSRSPLVAAPLWEGFDLELEIAKAGGSAVAPLLGVAS